MKLILATHNQGKVREMAQYLAELGLEVLSLADVGAPQVDEVGTTLWENAKLKAVTAASQTGSWALGEDTGLEVDALRGAPGVYSARYAGSHATDQENNAKLLKELQGVPQDQRTARFKTVMVLASPAGRVWTTEGVLEGAILTAPRGSGGFGYDPLFWVAVGKPHPGGDGHGREKRHQPQGKSPAGDDRAVAEPARRRRTGRGGPVEALADLTKRLLCRTISRSRGTRGVAQFGSAPALGAGGREFKSHRPDHFVGVPVLRWLSPFGYNQVCNAGVAQW